MSDLGYTSYKPPRGPEPEDMEWVAERVAEYCKRRVQKYKEEGRPDYQLSTEDVIEIFRSMNDDYDDWWARGLNTKEKSQAFVKELLSRMEKYDVTDVVDDTFV